MAGTQRTGFRGKMGISLASAIVATLALGACVSYTNVPVPESAPAYASANNWQSIKVTRTALAAVINRFPAAGPDGRYAINLPNGTSRETAFKIIAGLPEGAILPYEGMGGEIPVYHISRIWIRASDAKVDVLYPITDVRGNRLQGTVTVWLYGGISNWRADRFQSWAPGTIPTPPIYVPLSEETLRLMREQEKALGRSDGMDDAAAMEPVEGAATDDSGEQAAPSEPATEPATEPDTQPSAETVPDAGSGATYRQVPIED